MSASQSASASRANSWDVHKEKEDDISRSPSPPRPTKEDNNISTKGCVAGGKYLKDLEREDVRDQENGPLKEVDIEMPLTQTEIIHQDDKEYILLTFREGDPDDPFKWSKWRRRFISTLLNLMTLFIGLATTAYSSGISSMVDDLNTSTELGEMGLFCFNMACAVAPLFLAPFCEMVGRKVVYSGAYLCFCLCFIGLALGKNIATILVMRTLLGLFGCVGTILVGGTFADMYDNSERARPMSMFAFVAIFGTVAAPIYAGFIDQCIGWRWIEGIQGLSNIPLLIIIFVFFRETRGGVALQKRAKALRNATGDERYTSLMDLDSSSVKDMLNTSCVKALHMLVTEPVVLCFGIWIGFSWAVVFLFLSVIPITFETKRGWSEGVAGLPYISLCIGVTLGYIAHHQYQMKKYLRLSQDPNHKMVPEERLYGAMFGSIFLPIGLFCYSFTQYGYLPWIAPTISLAPIAFGTYFVFEATYSFTSDCYGENSGSAIAGQGLLRNTLGAVTPLFATQFFTNVGSQYAGLILALVGSVLSLIPFVFFKYGHILRKRSKLARQF